MIVLLVALAGLILPTLSLVLTLAGHNPPGRAYLFSLAGGACLAWVGIATGLIIIKIMAAVALILTFREIAWYRRIKERVAAIEAESRD